MQGRTKDTTEGHVWGDSVRLYIGLDGGGSKSEVFLFDLDDTSGLFCTGEGSNPSTVGWEQVLRIVERLIEEALNAIGGTPQEVAGLSLCMSGVDRREQIERIRGHFAGRFPNATLDFANDALASLSAGTAGSPGVVLVAGTGSIAVGEGADGKVARAGGFGYLVGDEGGGFAIGRQGLEAAIKFGEGRGEVTSLLDRMRSVFGIHALSDIIPAIYQADHPVRTVASFAPMVLAEAAVDTVAGRIVQRAAKELGALVRSVLRQLADQSLCDVVLSGGLLAQESALRSALDEQLPDLNLTAVAIRPAAGAALRAVVADHADVWRNAIDAGSLRARWEAAIQAAASIPG